ncbi:MAG: TIGR04053 family radical SAM/SPASM domain-containing protein [Candidatus Carbobacillus altaicus]|nr:TIGR04053 family radical SAM/SPASM domain-containing protein [Candidatus Carbobacillus altaicus]
MRRCPSVTRPYRDFSRVPLLVFWEVTQACLLQCTHCRADAQFHADPEELTEEEGYALLRDIAELDRPLLILSGGDPLMRADIFRLTSYAKELGLPVALTPSATPKLTPDKIRQALESGVKSFALSLDASNEKAHDRFRGTPGSYKRTLNALTAMRALGAPVQINTTVSRYNVAMLEEMADLLSGLDIQVWSLFFLVPTGRASQDLMLSAEETEAVFARLYRLEKKVPFIIKTTEAPHYRRFQLISRTREKGEALSTLFTTIEKGILPQGRMPRTRDGNGVLFISHRGDIYPSGFLPIRAGNVRQDKLADIYRHHPLFQTLRDPDQFYGKCSVCEFRKLCGGSRARAYAVTGDVLSAEPTCLYQPRALSGAV